MARILTSLCATFLILGLASAQSDTSALTANEWVQPTEAGELSGRIAVPSGEGTSSSVEGANVTITSVDGGGFSGQAVTDGMGEFTISGVTPGVYALTARAANAYAHLAIQVIDSSIDLGGRYPNIAEISAANMGYEAVSATIMRYRPPSNDRIITMANADLDALANQIINNETHRVSRFDGGLNGKLFVAGADGPTLIPAAMTNVFIMKNGVEVGRDITNELGDFRIDVLPAGSYSLLAIGRDGMVAIGFEVVAQNGGDVAKLTASGRRLVSAAKATDSFGCQLAPFTDGTSDEGDQGEDGVVLDQPIDFFDGYGTNMTGGRGQGGGYYGGGGGGGSYGGFGDIAGLAGIGIAIAAIVSDDDGPKIASPTAP